MNTQLKEKTSGDDRHSLVTKFAVKYNVEADKMMSTLKATAFKQKRGKPEVSNEQMMALLIVADQYNLNPFTREIYAFPDKKKGIIPVVGVDGWSRIINSNKEYDGIEFLSSVETETMEDAKESPVGITCTIYRKDRSHPTVITEFLNECYRPPFEKDNYKVDGPWQTHTKRMLRHKAMIQCARIAFSFGGIYEEDEAQRIAEGMTFDGEVVDHESQETKKLNESILNGGNKKIATDRSKQKQIETTKEGDSSSLDDVFAPKVTNEIDLKVTNKIDLIASIKAAKENDLLGLDALILDLEGEDMAACKKEMSKRKDELSIPDGKQSAVSY